MADDDVVDRLGSVDLFANLKKREIESLAKRARVVQHEAGREVASEGREGVAFHLILDGTATVVLHGKEIRTLKPGDYFGEISLIDGNPRSATVRVEQPMRTLSITSWEFRPLLSEEPEIARGLLVKLCQRLREAEQRVPAAG